MTDENQPPTGGQRSRPEPEGAPEVGSVAEEAAQLFVAFGDWAKQQGGDYAGAAGGAAHIAQDAMKNFNEHIATGGEDCKFCPLCQAISLVRSTSPEVKAHLLVAANSLVQAAAGVLATQTPADRGGAPVEKIDLDGGDDSDWDETQ